MLNQKGFRSFNKLTIGSVYLLILVGAVVRSQEAGMGCPDWPKCFGGYYPPLSSEQLPEDYQDQLRDERLSKNERLAKLIGTMGFEKLAERIVTDQNIARSHEFNATKAWIEYVNRLIGVAIGIFVFFNMIFSFQYRKVSLLIPILGISVFILTGFQGWVGSLVVSTNLLPGFITFHMAMALLIVVLLIWMRVLAFGEQKFVVDSKSVWILGLLSVLLIPQIITGTLTREQVDVLLDNGVARNMLGESLIGSFLIHRSYSWILLVVSGLTYLLLVRNGQPFWARVVLGMVILEMLAGVWMVYGSFSKWIQPVHLVIATMLLGCSFYLFLMSRRSSY